MCDYLRRNTASRTLVRNVQKIESAHPTKVWDEQRRCFVPENPDAYWKWYNGDRGSGVPQK
jgi:hypothetical protein